MENSFFPFVGNEMDYNVNRDIVLPPLYELAYDFKNNDYIINPKTNDFEIVTGKEALKVWIYMTLMTNRYEHEIYSWDYGTELITLIGQKFTRGLTESEAFRYVKEALMVNPYIEEVKNKGITFKDNKVSINLYVKSKLGGVEISV